MNKTRQITAAISIGLIAYLFGYFQGQSPSPSNTPDNRSESADTPPQSKKIAKQPSPTSEPTEPQESIAEKTRPTRSTPEQKPDLRIQGHEAAESDLATALQNAESKKGREQMQYLRGIFSYLAENRSPREALTIANNLPTQSNRIALKTLVSEWAVTSRSLSESEASRLQGRIFSVSGNQFGVEVELASVLSQNNVNPTVAKAWIDTFSNHPGRSEIQARLIAGKSPDEIQQALKATQAWTPWERENFSESLVYQWSQKEPIEAWNWYSKNGDELDRDYSTQIIQTWSAHNPDELISVLDQFERTTDRQTAIESIASSLAKKGTQAALDWVAGLADQTEQDQAYQAVYKATPKGIGAMVSMQNGFPQIRQLIPGGALESTDIQSGDLLVEASENGSSYSLYGKPLNQTIGNLRGEPGSTVELRYLRENTETGELEEHTTTVIRDLLILGDPNED